MNFLLLQGCMYLFKLRRQPFVYLRMSLGALFGAFSALLMVSANLWEGIIVNIYKISSVLIIVMISFGCKGMRALFLQALAFYGISFAFAGAITALIFFDGSLGEIHNGVVYWRINSNVMDIVLAVAVVTIAGYSIFVSIKERVYDGERIVPVRIVLAGVEYTAEALVDTGNELKEPFSGRSAIIVDDKIIPIDLQAECFKTKTRFVPYKALGNENGALTGVIPDSVEATIEKSAGGHANSTIKIDRAIVCLCKQKLSEDDKYNAIINYELLG